MMSRYDEIKSVHGTNSCSAFYKGTVQAVGKSNFNNKLIKVLPSDFICDVELAARAALSKEEYRFFKLVYLDKDQDLTTDAPLFADTKRAVQEKVGRMLQTRGIYPIHRYLQTKDLR